uniref:(northern house mosquito) hypothetical protein n=1 Tax=Culex pipiens TaxID=7175 RepID=A0A8D8AWT6_CULPI
MCPFRRISRKRKRNCNRSRGSTRRRTRNGGSCANSSKLFRKRQHSRSNGSLSSRRTTKRRVKCCSKRTSSVKICTTPSWIYGETFGYSVESGHRCLRKRIGWSAPGSIWTNRRWRLAPPMEATNAWSSASITCFIRELRRRTSSRMWPRLFSPRWMGTTCAFLRTDRPAAGKRTPWTECRRVWA